MYKLPVPIGERCRAPLPNGRSSASQVLGSHSLLSYVSLSSVPPLGFGIMRCCPTVYLFPYDKRVFTRRSVHRCGKIFASTANGALAARVTLK